ncbi:MAG: hypothetical protein JNK58_04750 [Phycisphaerae bacterium]|nr:hypothetical protein [Phycisphaerae bacterium]
MTRLLQVFSIAIVTMVALIVMPSAAIAQSQSVSVADQKNTERSIRTINRTAASAELGLSRLSTSVETLLNRLAGSGASDTRMTDVAIFYQRSATAARYRAESKINVEANKQSIKLRAKANSEALLADLEDARQTAIANIAAAEAETLDSIGESLDTVLNL